ncbi:thiamine pyrophosphate-binding protein [Bifidobacterium pseudolongum subsp. globosum]|jgi:2-succinyl-5-enolpyruvyl-6-hydroxy-3-cyclohexene-1-carboxylate synthase|uniref:Thiamine pyrophosphate-binding protein n=1 Tax=Bifidobacterium pseudolongum subsp. globosum TaxID=1690 RepID=A0A4Q5BBL4_9BIFI|nr:thiamine pyrophosphate-binding protein [Bifidobacterium pseudolongum]RYQ03879.1 thiamine pyrophosphate-binding protein [Bifidobacterium pseudolongum subsp. globosum]RYQ08749.1 thiamine pyrophosphate-binding protein [Bifidobacterium pseudolongum subsp. globosum]RYQ12811.1 thiamine pyrophosphate-binding protein [Bifidobacterium pseudolongum subsp. globosum]RYQ15408.1 thiamine pyrophosphate-binding protein [Bifidobacterium pseudolongum subsp. globosum]RYQ67445.1 thiamine pyrophosphate-binding 
MINGYSDEVNVQILVALMKHHHVQRVVASPGATNVTFLASLQNDPYFTIYSSVDERSAAYMACGIAAETGQPVALTCTGATASRNYMPGLTEAYYRKLPILAVTSSQHLGKAGNMSPQMLDRTSEPNDICKISVQCPSVYSEEDRWACEAMLNRALLELTHTGGGPVHVNLVTTYNTSFSTKELPAVRYVDRVDVGDSLPSLVGKRVAIYVGAHAPWSSELTAMVDRFCATYNAVVLGDHTSNYSGDYWVDGSLIMKQENCFPSCRAVDVLIHIGEISGAYASPLVKEVWRVSLDGEPRDAFNKLRYIFNMEESVFFDEYAKHADDAKSSDSMPGAFLQEWLDEDAKLRAKIPELPFSNIWCAQQTAPVLPSDSVLHLGILNSLRSWNFFPVDRSIRCYANTGGFGIDGCMSSLIGASLVSPDKLFFGVVGDLACFYDLNSLGNHNVQPNMRIMVINNGVGAEFKNYNHNAAHLGEDADAYIAARGHYGNKSHELLKHYSQDLGFEYMSADNKEGFLAYLNRFTTSEFTDRPMVFEVFTNSDDESEALHMMSTLEKSASSVAKGAVKNILGERGVNTIKKILGK